MAAIENAEQTSIEYSRGYSADVDIIREQEYPQLNGTNTKSLGNSHILISV